MYIPIGTTAVFSFTLIQLIMIPVTYTLILISKAWNIPIKPIFGCKDTVNFNSELKVNGFIVQCISLRFLDFFVFLAMGIFILLFWVGIDFINYIFKLFDSGITTISTHEEEAQEKINKQMDGSIRYKDGVVPINQEEQVTFRSVNKVLNPIKEGLAANTLKVMKACIKITRDEHFNAVGKMDKDQFKYTGEQKMAPVH